MSLETGTYISDLDAANPVSTDPKSQGDDHLRLIKSTVKATFPNVAGAVTADHTELSYVDGVTSAIQTQIDLKAPLASPTLTGTPTAPTAAPGTGTTQLATCEFVVSQSFSSALPGQAGNGGKFLTTDGAAASWSGVPPAVSSVGMTVPAFLSVAGSPITTSGTLAVSYSGTALPVLYGGTGVTTSTGSGANVLGTTPVLNSPAITTPTITGTKETKTAIGASDIDMSVGNYFSKTISGTTTFTVSNVPSTGTAVSIILDLTNGGSATVNWWAGMDWPAGTAPTLTAAGRDVLGFFTHDGGTTWTGLVLGLDVK